MWDKVVIQLRLYVIYKIADMVADAENIFSSSLQLRLIYGLSWIWHSIRQISSRPGFDFYARFQPRLALQLKNAEYKLHSCCCSDWWENKEVGSHGLDAHRLRLRPPNACGVTCLTGPTQRIRLDLNLVSPHLLRNTPLLPSMLHQRRLATFIIANF